MIRKIGKQGLAASLAAAFLLVGNGEGYGLRECPHHERLAGGHAASHAGAHAAATDEAGRSAHPSSEAGSGTEGAQHGEHDPDDGPCSCLGACHGSATTPLGAVPPGPIFTTAAAAASGFTGGSARIHFRTPYLLPLANAPPSV